MPPYQLSACLDERGGVGQLCSSAKEVKKSSTKLLGKMVVYSDCDWTQGWAVVPLIREGFE